MTWLGLARQAKHLIADLQGDLNANYVFSRAVTVIST